MADKEASSSYAPVLTTSDEPTEQPLAKRNRLSPTSDEQTEQPLAKRKRLPPPRLGRRIMVLSIDGGGIRGLIPAVVLQRLEEKLQSAEEKMGDADKDVRIADYFDVVAGTSTGALIAAMLVTPTGDNKRPYYTPNKIVDFYVNNGSSIFPPIKGWWSVWPLGMIRPFRPGPKYDCTFLHQEIKRVTDDKTLSDTLSRLVVPTFDVHRMEPVVFSSFEDHLTNEDKEVKEIKPKLSDVCIGTSAAPTFFSAHTFTAYRPGNVERSEFHLIDGGVTANNPTMAAISRITREQLLKNEDFPTDVDYKKYLVLSVGTGAAVEAEGTYTAKDCSKWSDVNWVRKNGHSPIIDMFSHANDFLVDFQVAMLLHNSQQLSDSYLNNEQLHSNYLRIQAQGSLFDKLVLPKNAMTDPNKKILEEKPVLPKDTAADPNMETLEELMARANFSLDSVTPENMKSLADIGNKLLERKVARVDLTMGRYLTDKNARTNDEELQLFAELLVKERRLRINKEEEEEKEKEKGLATGEGTSLSLSHSEATFEKIAVEGPYGPPEIPQGEIKTFVKDPKMEQKFT